MKTSTDRPVFSNSYIYIQKMGRGFADYMDIVGLDESTQAVVLRILSTLQTTHPNIKSSLKRGIRIVADTYESIQSHERYSATLAHLRTLAEVQDELADIHGFFFMGFPYEDPSDRPVMVHVMNTLLQKNVEYMSIYESRLLDYSRPNRQNEYDRNRIVRADLRNRGVPTPPAQIRESQYRAHNPINFGRFPSHTPSTQNPNTQHPSTQNPITQHPTTLGDTPPTPPRLQRSTRGRGKRKCPRRRTMKKRR